MTKKGVLDTTTSLIEHPRLIAQRLMNYVRLVGPNNVIACTDCVLNKGVGGRWKSYKNERTTTEEELIYSSPRLFMCCS